MFCVKQLKFTLFCKATARPLKCATMPVTKPKPAAKPARRPKPAKPIRAEVLPPAEPEPSANELDAYAALIATGKNGSEATRILRPHLAADSLGKAANRFAHRAGAKIEAARQAASAASVAVLGIDQAYYVRHLKDMLETPLSAITPESIYCKKYKITETHTDAGPKTTVEVEKPCPLATLTQISKALALDKAQPGTEAEQARAGAAVTLADFVARVVQPGSPITRRLEAARLAAGQAAGA